MSRFQWAVSVLLLYHLAAVGLVALPPPDALPVISAQPSQDDAIASVVTPAVDAAASTLARAEARLLALAEPIARLTYWYEQAGIRQKWSMFAAPKTDQQFLRINYVVSDRSQKSLVVRELVLPAQPDNRVRFRHDFRDKAILNAIDAFFARGDGPPSLAAVQAAKDDFAPIVRYFRGQYRQYFLAAGEDIIRTEVWYGLAPMPPRGRSLPDGRLSTRLEVLRQYYNGPVRSAGGAINAPSRHSEEREADIVWTLEYVE